MKMADCKTGMEVIHISYPNEDFVVSTMLLNEVAIKNVKTGSLIWGAYSSINHKVYSEQETQNKAEAEKLIE